jgi:MFS family permease
VTVAVAASALVTGWVAGRWGLRPEPFLLGVVYVALGLGLSAGLVRETLPHARRESALAGGGDGALGARAVLWKVTFADRELSAVTQAGLVNNLNDGMAWGLFPLIFGAAGLGLAEVGALAALYPAVWGVAQLGTGALSDRVGRKGLIAGGMAVQALGLACVATGESVPAFAIGQVLLGLGTAMVYPTLLAAIGDVAHPAWRASAMGVYRLWRDLGYAAGALLAGVVADAFGAGAAVWLVAALTLLSGATVALRMRETLRR